MSLDAEFIVVVVFVFVVFAFGVAVAVAVVGFRWVDNVAFVFVFGRALQAVLRSAWSCSLDFNMSK